MRAKQKLQQFWGTFGVVIQLGNGKSTFWYFFAGYSAIKTWISNQPCFNTGGQVRFLQVQEPFRWGWNCSHVHLWHGHHVADPCKPSKAWYQECLWNHWMLGNKKDRLCSWKSRCIDFFGPQQTSRVGHVISPSLDFHQKKTSRHLNCYEEVGHFPYVFPGFFLIFLDEPLISALFSAQALLWCPSQISSQLQAGIPSGAGETFIERFLSRIIYITIIYSSDWFGCCDARQCSAAATSPCLRPGEPSHMPFAQL